MKKRWLSAALAAVFLLLAGCTDLGGVTEFDATLYVRGYLDEAYLGKEDAAFLRLVDGDRDEAQAHYNACIDAQYDYLCQRLSIDDALLTDDTREGWKDFLRTLLARARYEVAAAVRMEGDEYAVRVTVHPLTLPREVMRDDYDAFVTDFNSKHKTVTQERLAAMSLRARELALQEYETAWAEGLLALFTARMGVVSYGDAAVKLVRVYPEEGEYYVMSDLDLAGLDELILLW